MIKIPVKSSKGIQFTEIDFCDLDVLGYKWYAMKSGYIFRNTFKGEPEHNGIKLLHREIMKPPGNLTVDHINRNKADNRRVNLRLATRKEQSMNLGARKDNKSGILGVYKRADCNRWSAFIQRDGKHEYLGLFKTKNEAIEVRLKKEKELFGHFKERC